MAETTTTATAQAAASDGAQTQATGTKVTDLGMVDEKALQSYRDAEVRKALKTREDNLNAEKATALKKAEQDAALARGEFDTVRKQLEADKAQAQAEVQAVRVSHELKVHALQAGIQDPDDVRLLSPEVLATLLDEKGVVNREAVKRAIEGLKTSKGYLFKSTTAAPAPAAFSGAPSPGTAVPATPPQDLTEAAWFRAREQHVKRTSNINPPSATDIVAAVLNNRK